MILVGLVIEASLVIISATVVAAVAAKKHERNRPDTPEELEDKLFWEWVRGDLDDDDV